MTVTHRIRGLNVLHFTLQALGVVLLFWIWAFFIFDIFTASSFAYRRYFVYSLVLGAALLLDSSRSRIQALDLFDLDFRRNHSVSLRETLVMLGALLLLLVGAKDQVISRLFLFSYTPILYGMLFASNRYLPRFLATFVFDGRHQQRTVLLGSAKSAVKLRQWLERKAMYGFQPAGLVTDDLEVLADTVPILGTVSELRDVLRETNASQLIVLDMPASVDHTLDLANFCDKLGVRLIIVNDFQEKLCRTVSFVEDDGFHFISFRHEPLESPLSRIVKRLFDIILSLPVVVFLLPWMNLLVWVLQRFQAPGPLLFCQKRIGRHNREFLMYKYRTMYFDQADEDRQATFDDPRVYAAGKWLRKLSIDELPQFINVLKGEMSIVGPRPHLKAHDMLFGEIANYYRVRSFIKPGITGLAQVRGLRGETRKEKDLVDRVESDIYYLENWSIFLDSMIIIKTAWQFFQPPKSAY